MLQQFLDKLPELVTLVVIMYGFIQMHKSDTKFEAMTSRIDSANQRLDALYSELISLRKGN